MKTVIQLNEAENCVHCVVLCQCREFHNWGALQQIPSCIILCFVQLCFGLLLGFSN